MPRLDKAIRRERKQQNQRKMGVSGRGLLTSPPDEEARKQRRKKRNKR